MPCECICACVVHAYMTVDRLVFPWRTFNMRASTAADAKEWMQLLNWKLVRSSVIHSGCSNDSSIYTNLKLED